MRTLTIILIQIFRKMTEKSTPKILNNTKKKHLVYNNSIMLIIDDVSKKCNFLFVAE